LTGKGKGGKGKGKSNSTEKLSLNLNLTEHYGDVELEGAIAQIKGEKT
jgi:hypothetical protein